MELHFNVSKPIDLVFEYLTNMDLFVQIHPVIYKSVERAPFSYQVYEKMNIGIIPYKFNYPVILSSDSANKIIDMKAVVSGLVHIDMQFQLSTVTLGTNITETVTFKSKLPVKVLMEKVFKKQHKLLFENLNAIAF